MHILLSMGWRLILLGCIGVIAGCATPRLEGVPDVSGLVIVETNITSGNALGTINVSGRVKIASLTNPQIELVGKPYKNTNYHIFAGISPGVYKLVAVAYSVGNQNTTLTFGESMSKVPRGTFDVRPGEPYYVGKLKVSQKIEGFPGKMYRDTALEYGPPEEKKAWETLVTESSYADSPWFPRIKQRLEQITQ